MAEVLPHPGATGTSMPMVEPDPCEGKPSKRDRDRDDASVSLWSAFVRGRVSPLTALFGALLLGGGSGVGGSWLFGPGGVADDTALRNDISKLTNDATQEREAAAKERAAAAEEREAAAKDRAAQAKRIDELATAVKSCEDTIENVDGGQHDLQEWIGDAMLVHNRALDDIADKIDVRVDLRLRPMATRGKGRHR